MEARPDGIAPDAPLASELRALQRRVENAADELERRALAGEPFKDVKAAMVTELRAFGADLIQAICSEVVRRVLVRALTERAAEELEDGTVEVELSARALEAIARRCPEALLSVVQMPDAGSSSASS